MAVMDVEAANQVTDSRLGLPNPDSICRSCGSKDRKVCEGIIYILMNPILVILSCGRLLMIVFGLLYRAFWCY